MKSVTIFCLIALTLSLTSFAQVIGPLQKQARQANAEYKKSLEEQELNRQQERLMGLKALTSINETTEREIEQAKSDVLKTQSKIADTKRRIEEVDGLVAAAATPHQETSEEGEAIRKIIERAEDHYKTGIALIIAHRPQEATKAFNAAVDVILESGYEVKKYKYLDQYYIALVEKIYSAETRATQDFIPNTSPVIPSVTEDTTESGCKLENKEKINLRGFRLGETMVDVKRRIPRFTVPSANKYGFARNLVKPAMVVRDANFKDVRVFGFEFVDNKVTALRVLYSNTTDWPSAAEFVNQVAESLGIHGAWEPYATDDYRYVDKLWRITCGDSKFMAGFADINGKQYLYLTWEDIAADKLIYQRVVTEAERKRKEAEMRRRTFRP
jgi:hypothetical protein